MSEWDMVRVINYWHCYTSVDLRESSNSFSDEFIDNYNRWSSISHGVYAWVIDAEKYSNEWVLIKPRHKNRIDWVNNWFVKMEYWIILTGSNWFEIINKKEKFPFKEDSSLLKKITNVNKAN